MNKEKHELLMELNSEDKNKVRIAVEKLSKYDDPEVVKALIKTAVKRKSKSILEAVKASLISMKSKEICREAVRLFKYTEPKLRQLAIDVLTSKGDECISEILEYLAKSKDYNMRKFALDIASRLKTKSAFNTIKELINDENPNVRNTAVEYLKELADMKDEVVLTLIDSMKYIKDLYSATTFATTIIYGNFKDQRLTQPLKELLAKFKEPLIRHWIYKTLLFLGCDEVIGKALENAKKLGMEKDLEKDIEIFGVNK